MNIDLRQGDCLEVLKTIPDNSIDSVVTDPPYHLTSSKGDKKGFMGKDWDGGDIAFRTDVWSECYRVLKPGGHLLAFSHSRTYHRMAVAIEDSGFDIRDQIMWIYGSGFPKSHNIGKAIDKIQGNERVIGKSKGTFVSSGGQLNGENTRTERFESKGNSDYEGWGTALKPAHEPIVMARKPLSEKSIAENVLKWGTGGINIDECRIGSEVRTTPIHSDDVKDDTTLFGLHKTIQHERVETTEGRFPANIILDEEAGKVLDEQSGYGKGQKNPKVQKGSKRYGENQFANGGMLVKDGWVSSTYDDKGGASRFFYCPKTSKKEKGEENNHPTVKPLKLMEYLIKLVTPKGGVVMDCFMGSGSTGVAARNLGFKFIGIEREQEYMDIAKQRITQPVQTKLDI